MRTKNLLAAALLLISSASFAQGVSFGLKAGLNLANISSDAPDYSSDMRIGFHVGGGVLISAGDKVAINADLLYTQKGAKQTTDVTQTAYGVTVTEHAAETITISYIEIPVLARLSLASGMYFNAGPYVSFFSSYKDEYTATETVTGQAPLTISGSSTDHTGLSSTDFGLKAGLGFKLPAGLDIAVNYNLGLSNMIDVTDNTYTAHNGVIGFTFGYWIK